MSAVTHNPGELVVVLDSFSGPHGSFVQGQQVRASHPAVAATPHLFAPSGLSNDEFTAARAGLYDRAIEIASQQAASLKAQQVKQRQVVCIESFVLDYETAAGMGYHAQVPSFGVLSISEGDTFPVDHVAVKVQPTKFVPVSFAEDNDLAPKRTGLLNRKPKN